MNCQKKMYFDFESECSLVCVCNRLQRISNKSDRNFKSTRTINTYAAHIHSMNFIQIMIWFRIEFFAYVCQSFQVFLFIIILFFFAKCIYLIPAWLYCIRNCRWIQILKKCWIINKILDWLTRTIKNHQLSRILNGFDIGSCLPNDRFRIYYFTRFVRHIIHPDKQHGTHRCSNRRLIKLQKKKTK